MSDTAIAWCAQCGTQREGETAFCGSCGSAFEAATTQSVPAAPAAPPAAGPAQGAPSAAVPQGYEVAYSPPQPAQKSKGLLIGAGVGAVVVAGAVAAFALLGGDAQDEPAPVVTATVTTTASAPPAVQAADQSAPSAAPVAEQPAAQQISREQAADSWPINETVYGISRTYPRASSLNGVTSRPFVGAVANAYAAAGGDGASRSISAYSSTTRRSYSMWCEAQPDTTVLCTGGNNARVLLW